ncbi:MAG: DUF11 domain-containing protein, partial [Acidobacteria bacterium]|nr:DUF11 domain-containing protein [Acidobacteriota bacterium]
MNKTRAAALFALAFLILPFASRSALADDGGYIMRKSSDAGGPAVDWIDISATGTLVTGLADENATAAISLPQPFHYFGVDYNTIRIGSNGWISFSNTSNIAGCFPTIPFPGGQADGYMAPYLADLTFENAGNPGTVRTYSDVANGRFIVSYLNVPHWSSDSPGYTGSNTFQLILEFASRTVRFNYLALTDVPNRTSCNEPTVGIESGNGASGIEFNHGGIVPSPFSIELLAPGAIDVAPTSGLITSESGSSASFTVALASQPSANVTIPLASSDLSEGTIAISSLTFTPANWNVPRTVTVTGANDALVDGAIPYQIVLGTSVSTAPNYSGIDPSDVSLTNTDDDVALVTVGDVVIPEGTGSNPQVTFLVSVDKAVVGGFTVPFHTADGSATAPADYTTTSGTVTFAGTAGEVQSVPVTVIGDNVAEDTETFTLNLGIPSNARVVTSDNQAAGVIIDDDSADLSLMLSDAVDPVIAGTNLTYIATVTNNGPLPATSVTITMPLPANTSFVSGTVAGGGSCSGTPIVCTIAGSIAPNASRVAT